MVATIAASGRCAPAEHILPESARPGQVTKCRTCRASVRVPRDAQPVIPLAEHEEKLAVLRARAEAWKAGKEAELEAANDRIAELEEKLTTTAVWCGPHSREKLCPVCCGAADYA